MSLKKVLPVFLLIATLAVHVLGDIYLHSPRGSNNRLAESTRNRKNAKRLFNSQNNDRGGYNEGEETMSFHVGSILTIEWTNQHSCSGPNNNCQLILQYMCSDKIRNGDDEKTIELNKASDEDDSFGMHEDYAYYNTCKLTSRNKGLFQADQELEGSSAIYTRQQNQGTRYGFECPEERDYYPYWRSSPWKDIAVLTSDTSRCEYYKKESQNVKGRGICDLSKYTETTSLSLKEKKKLNRKVVQLPISKEKCEELEFKDEKDGKFYLVTGEWKEIKPHNIKAPDCIRAPASRDNHNGNGIGGFPNTYNWTIPDDVNEKCVFRIRYNISTGDYPTDTDSSHNGEYDGIGSQVDIEDEEEAVERNYVLTGNPEVLPLKVGNDIQTKFQLQLAINTAQFGRTFQDRSHVFGIKPRPKGISAKTRIYNLNVRGKRGNIVQTYPAVEYDFVPNRLHIKKGDAVHIQWTGSDSNPENNAGQGEAGTDRSNIVQLTRPQYEGVKNAKADKPKKFGHWANSYPDHLGKTKFLGYSLNDRKKLAYNAPAGSDDGGELDETSAYFNLGVRKVKSVGAYRYFCTRNNAFTNRGQKAVIIVSDRSPFGDSLKSSSMMQDSFRKELQELETLEREIKQLL